MEYCMAVRQVAHQDFVEGVRAALIDKDRQPAWLGTSGPHHVPASAVDKHNSDAGPQELPGNRFAVQQLFLPVPTPLDSTELHG